MKIPVAKTRVGKKKKSFRVQFPPDVADAMKVGAGDIISWTQANASGTVFEVRKVKVV